MNSNAWQQWYSRKEGTVEPEIPRLAELLKEQHASKILDLGCGAGRHIVYFAKQGFELYGFDHSETAIERVKAILASENLAAHLGVGDMTKPLPYEDEFFDGVLALRVIHHTCMANIERIVKEIDRVLRERGLLFLQVPAFSDEAMMKWKQEGLKIVEPEPRTHLFSSGEEKGVLHHFFTREELLGLFENYGIETIHQASDHYGGFCLIARK